MNDIQPPAPESAPHDPYTALRFGDFRLLVLGRFIAIIGEQMVGVAIGWELYERTGSALALGLVGLVQVLPLILLSLPGGQIADRFDRRRIAIITQLVLALCSLGLVLLSATRGLLVLIYGCLLLFGAARAFSAPAGALDNISVLIRGTLLLTETPDAMRGRVSAVNSMFIGASNELGGFESGVAAALLGPVAAVVAGGVGMILVVAAVALIWPEMRRLGRLGQAQHGEAR